MIEKSIIYSHLFQSRSLSDDLFYTRHAFSSVRISESRKLLIIVSDTSYTAIRIIIYVWLRIDKWFLFFSCLCFTTCVDLAPAQDGSTVARHILNFDSSRMKRRVSAVSCASRRSIYSHGNNGNGCFTLWPVIGIRRWDTCLLFRCFSFLPMNELFRNSFCHKKTRSTHNRNGANRSFFLRPNLARCKFDSFVCRLHERKRSSRVSNQDICTYMLRLRSFQLPITLFPFFAFFLL